MLNIAGIHARFRSGELTPLELLEECLARVDEREGDVQAWVMLDREGALRIASEQTARLSRLSASDALTPLFGIPLGIKDIFDVAGWPTKAGSSLRESHRAETDAPVVARLRAAGAVFLGKTVTTEFASFDPSPTRNPWHWERTPGGSSSGSAAAVACGMCVAAIGSQTGGSIVRPASYCGVVGFKPSYGRAPLEGVVPLAPSMDHVGAMARNVADVARVFGVISNLSASGGRQPPGASSLTDTPIRFGVLRDFFCTEAEPENAAVFDAVMVHLENSLGSVNTASLSGSIAEVHRCHRVVMACECAAYHREAFLRHRDAYGFHIAKLIDEGLQTPKQTYDEALACAARFRQDAWQLLESFDVLAMPATHGAAPSAETTGDPRWQNVWSFAGLPAITLPCGFAALNLPLGLQLVAADDQPLLEIASTCEEVLAIGDEIERLMR